MDTGEIISGMMHKRRDYALDAVPKAQKLTCSGTTVYRFHGNTSLAMKTNAASPADTCYPAPNLPTDKMILPSIKGKYHLPVTSS